MKQTKMAEELMFLLLPLHSPILWKCSICFFIFLSLETIPQWIVAPTYETLACALPTNVSCKNEVFFFPSLVVPYLQILFTPTRVLFTLDFK